MMPVSPHLTGDGVIDMFRTCLRGCEVCDTVHYPAVRRLSSNTHDDKHHTTGLDKQRAGGISIVQILTPSECCPVWRSAAVAPLLCLQRSDSAFSSTQMSHWIFSFSVDQQFLKHSNHATFKVTSVPFLHHPEARVELEHGVLAMAAFVWLNSNMQLNSVPKKQSGSCV